MSAAGRIVNDVNDLKDDAANLAEDTATAGEESFRFRAAEIERLLRRAEDAVTDLYDSMLDRGQRSIETVEETVEENPWLSLLAAFAAGALVTHLLSRR